MVKQHEVSTDCEMTETEAAFESGYAAGKEKSYFEMFDALANWGAHSPTCGCQPCLVIRVVAGKMVETIKAAPRGRRCRPWWSGSPWGTAHYQIGRED